MQSDLPQGDPRLQPVDPGHASVAVRIPQPCLFFVETTLRGELPLLGVSWANDTREVRQPGQPVSIEMRGVISLQNEPTRRKLWVFSQRFDRSVFLIHSPAPQQLARLSYISTSFDQAPAPTFKWAMRPLDHETHSTLRKLQFDFPNDLNALVSAVLQLSDLDWQSIADAQESLAPRKFRKASVPRRRNTIGRLISSIFQKKPQPAHA